MSLFQLSCDCDKRDDSFDTGLSGLGKTKAERDAEAAKRKADAAAKHAANVAAAAERKGQHQAAAAAHKEANAAKKVAASAARVQKAEAHKAAVAEKKAAKIAKRVGGKTVAVDAKDSSAVDAISAAVEASKKKNADLKAKLADLKAKRKKPGMKGLAGMAARVHHDATRKASHAARSGDRAAFVHHRRQALQAMTVLSGLSDGQTDPNAAYATNDSALVEMMRQQLADANAQKTVACSKRPNSPKCLYATMSADSKQQMMFMMTILDQINSNNEVLMQQILDALAELKSQDAVDPNTVQYVDPNTGQVVYPNGQQPTTYYPDSGMMTQDPYGGDRGYDPSGGGFIDTGAGGTPAPSGDGMTYSPMPGAEIASEGYGGDGPTAGGAAESDNMYSDGGLEYEAEPTADAGYQQIVQERQSLPQGSSQPMTQSMVSTDDYENILTDEMQADGGDIGEEAGDFGMSGMADANADYDAYVKAGGGTPEYRPPASGGGSTVRDIFGGITGAIQTSANAMTQYQQNKLALKQSRYPQPSYVTPLLVVGGLALVGAVLLKSRRK